MDEFDRASEIEERDRALCLFAALHPKTDLALEHTGRCHNCGEDVDLDHLFCDKDCSDDYEKRQRMRRITGKA